MMVSLITKIKSRDAERKNICFFMKTGIGENNEVAYADSCL